MIALAATIIMAGALLAAVAGIGAAFEYGSEGRRADQWGAYACPAVALVLAFVAGLML